MALLTRTSPLIHHQFWVLKVVNNGPPLADLLFRQCVCQFVGGSDHRIDQPWFRIRVASTANKFTVNVFTASLEQGSRKPPCRLWLTHVISTAMADGYLHVR